jgi:hypothetical protein
MDGWMDVRMDGWMNGWFTKNAKAVRIMAAQLKHDNNPHADEQ